MERLKKFFGFLELFIIAMFITILLYTYVFRLYTVNGSSMCETLHSGDIILISMINKEYEQGDIVVAYADNRSIVKRIIAIGGQTIDIDFGSGAVYIDDKRYFEEYLTLGLTHKNEGAFEYPVTVPENCVFVMGDNRAASLDSRSEDIGFIPVENITGKVVLKIFPYDDSGVPK